MMMRHPGRRAHPIRRLIRLLHLWHQRHLTRRVLRDLDTHLLSDIGRSDAERWRECAKWFWQA